MHAVLYLLKQSGFIPMNSMLYIQNGLSRELGINCKVLFEAGQSIRPYSIGILLALGD